MNDELHPDLEGEELPDTDHAIEEAIMAAREILADAIRAGKEPLIEAIVIADGRGQQIEVVPLAEVLPKRLLKSH
jgi:Mg-chelatase subunit ChlD